jgi:hypothetical protein
MITLRRALQTNGHTRRSFFLTLATLPAAGIVTGHAADAMNTPDAISRPPAKRIFVSPAGRYKLIIENRDNWQTQEVVAALEEIVGVATRTVWQQALPHRMGPRAALVTDNGDVVLIDEWINSPSPYALSEIDVRGTTIAQYSLDQLIAALAVGRRAVSDNAHVGIWMSSPPVLRSDGASVEFRCAGKKFSLRLSDGALSIEG